MTYPLNPVYVVYFKHYEGWWRAYDVAGRWHQVSGDDDGAVEALMGKRKRIVSPRKGFIRQGN